MDANDLLGTNPSGEKDERALSDFLFHAIGPVETA
jgi:hypothetical protein